ncbi:MAG: GAF domain-containing protein, partial [Desulfobacca sp.]|uniref:GAF domain-containing protein n=1 Tax=Desulfobacca sp. TaxID=2067990 RepID=UPI004048EBB9
HRLRRLLRLGAIGATLLVFLMGRLFSHLLEERARGAQEALSQQYIQQFELLLQNEMAHGHSLAMTVAGAPVIQRAMASLQEAFLDAANVELDRYSASFPGTVIYLMRPDGLTVASSNRRAPDSFVGKSYAFRPYFQQALSGRNGSYLALGATSGERGFYASAPILDQAGQIVGVAAVKLVLNRLEAMLPKDYPAFLVNRHGIIFLANQPQFILKSLWPVPEALLAQIIDSQQFGSGPFPPLLSAPPGSGSLVDFLEQAWLVQTRTLASMDWQIVVLGSLQPLLTARMLGLSLTLFLCLTALGFFLVWDITLEASGRIGATEQLYQSLIEGAPDCIALFNTQGQFLAINPNGLKVLGYTERDLLRLSLQELCLPQQRCFVAQGLQQVSQGKKITLTMGYAHPGGKTLALQVILNPIQEAAGQVERLVGIIADITERQKIEADLQFRLALEDLIVHISTEFINLPPEEIDAGINRTLQAIGSFVQVDRSYVFLYHDQGRLVSNTHEWCAPGIVSEKDNLQNLDLQVLFPWFAAQLQTEVCCIPRVADLPPEAQAEKVEFMRQGIQSLVVLSMVHQGQPLGFLGFDSVRQTRDWPEEIVTLLHMVGDILTNALARWRAWEALRLDEARLETLIRLGQMQDQSFQEIVTFALEEGVRLTRSRLGYLGFLNESETELTMYAWSHQTSKLYKMGQPQLVYQVEQTGPWGEAIRQRRPIITNDYAAPNPWKRGLPPGHVPVHRHLNLPIMEGNRIVAVVGVGNKQEPYDDADIRQLTLLMDAMWKLIQRKQSEEALAAEKDRLAVTLSSIGDAVLATDTAGKIQLMNHLAEELTGRTQAEALGQLAPQVLQLYTSQNRTSQPLIIPRLLAGETISEQSLLLLAKDGRERLIAASGAPIIDLNRQVRGAVLVFRDITLQRSLEEELLKMAKLRSLGLLAGGIAHDFNNILTAILGNLSLGLLEAEDWQSNRNIKARLREAEKATLRARDLVQRLLTFAKGGAPVKKLASLQDIVEESAIFAVSGSPSRCQFLLPPDLWPVEVDEGQFSQVIQNLVINAVQAMPSGGNITLAAANVVLDENSGLPLPAGRYVKLTVSDKGIGIPPEHLSHIFDPYFSTKQQGSGLGLATVFAIVNNHEGHITVASELGKGTAFTVYLPASTQQARPQRPAEAKLHQGRGRILIMDDEPMVREVVTRMLQRLGYEVAVAADGQEAVQRYQEALAEGESFDGVILDLTVSGGMGGREAMQRLLQLDPRVIGLVSSGYADDAVMTHYREYGFKGVIKKPYRLEELGKVLYETLVGQQVGERLH